MYCVIKCIVQGNQACVKNADLRHPSCTVVMQRRKSASPVLNVLTADEQGQKKKKYLCNKCSNKKKTCFTSYPRINKQIKFDIQRTVHRYIFL